MRQRARPGTPSDTRTAATPAGAATTSYTLFCIKTRPIICIRRTVLISAADQDNCCADHRAEKEGIFHHYSFAGRHTVGCRILAWLVSSAGPWMTARDAKRPTAVAD